MKNKLKYLPYYECFFFDFDGLLVNTEQLHFKAYKKMLENRGYTFTWDYNTFAGIAHKSSEGLKREILKTYSDLSEEIWPTLYREKSKLLENYLQEGEVALMPGAREMLESVEQLPHCVVTNSTLDQVESVKKHIPLLQKIPLWITRNDYKNPKPSPDSYLTAIEKMGMQGKRLIGFEDSLRGFRALEAAGIDPVLICSSNHPQMQNLDLSSIRHFESFHEFIGPRVLF